MKRKRIARAVPVVLALVLSMALRTAAQDWTLTSAPIASWTSVACSADGDKLVAAQAYGFIYTSTNGGVSWSRTTAPNTNWHAVASSADGSELAAAAEVTI